MNIPQPPLVSRLTRGRPRRRAILAGGAGLTAMLAGCDLPEPEAEAAAVEAAPMPVRAEALPAPPSSGPESALAALRRGVDPVIAGQALDGPLLRRFYALHDFEPVWDRRAAQAGALSAAVLRAGDHGLAPELFAGALLRQIGQLPPEQRELLLSHAALTYAQALAAGAVPPARRHDAQTLEPEPVDVAAAVQAALQSDDPAAKIEQLAPRGMAYETIRRALRRERQAGRPDGAAAQRLRLLAVNLERQRWLPRQLPPRRIWVNITDQSLVLFRDDRPVFTTRVVVGAEPPAMQSPELHTLIGATLLNPPWIIPEDILRRSILPRAEQDPGYLARRNITLNEDGEAEQAAGPDSALGAIMFDMPNRFDVYLHDTPDKAMFGLPNRRVSNGCIRVENPLRLAALVMDRPLAEIEAKVATGETLAEPVAEPMPVFLVYQTAFLSAGLALETRADFYGRDAALWRALQPPGARP